MDAACTYLSKRPYPPPTTIDSRMRILCVFGRYNYGDPARGEGIEYSCFIPALRALGHQVFFFESFARAGHSDFAALNRALLKQVEVFQPDAVFTVLMMAEVWLESIALMRRAGCKVINWSTDDSWKYREFSRLIAADFDVFATTCPDALSYYAVDQIRNVHLSQWGASAAQLAEPKPARDCRYGVSFVGSAYGNRPSRIAALCAAGVKVECFGHGWPSGAVAAERIPEIARDSVVSLNFSEAGNGSGLQIKARVFEVPAAGGMLLSEGAPNLEDYFSPGIEIAQFNGELQLLTEARLLLENSARRDSIARAGHARAVREHTYAQRLHKLLDQLDPASAGPRAIDWPTFEKVAARHTIGWPLKLLRLFLVLPCIAAWGRERGPRAARRALFEASWRLLGRHTYTASGLPGRLFYRQS